jgi:yeast amino acid transporter
MAQSGKAPSILGWTNKRGVPVWAILITNAVGSISMMNVSTGSAKAYSYIVNLSGVSAFLVWGSISLIHIRFRRAWIRQGRTVEELPYKAMFYPLTAWFGLGACIFLAIIQGWTTLSPFNAGNFVDAYILLPLFGIIYLIGKIYWRGQDPLKRTHEIDLDSGRRVDLDHKTISSTDDEEQVHVQQHLPIWKKVWGWL